MKTSLKNVGQTHQCNLEKSSESCLPRLAPHAGIFQRWRRQIRKVLTVSSNTITSNFFFRSHSAILNERKRHIRLANWYIIHPFSRFCFICEIVMCILWMFMFFKDPFTIAFHGNSLHSLRSNWWNMTNLFIDLMMCVFIMTNFITGFHKFKTKEVILDPRLIRKNYICTYFFFDLLGTIPFNYLIDAIFHTPENYDDFVCTMAACMHMFRFVRLKTMLLYFRRITELFHFGDSLHEILCLVLLTLYCTHWWGCIFYIIPKLQYSYYGYVSNTSWVFKAAIAPGTTSASLGFKYLACLHNAMCHFLRAGGGMYISEVKAEQVIFSLCMITGTLYFAYIIVKVLQMVNSACASENKYEEILHQLNHYMMDKQLPHGLRNRLLIFYENRFQKHYFRETAILSTLSEHLRNEIFLHSVKNLIEKVQLFQNAPKSVLGQVIACVKHEVFLPNDVILEVGEPTECLYFILFGTVAAYTKKGKEFAHFEDGDHFGGLILVRPDVTRINLISIVATEITEVFRLDKKDFHNTIAQQEEMKEQLVKVYKERYDRLITAEEEMDEDVKQKKHLLHQLKKGKVIEHGHGRRK